MRIHAITDNLECPNISNHISAFPAYDREKCPYCYKTYVLKEILKRKGG